MINVTTIGFTKTNAKGFFERIRSESIHKVIDVRLHNTSQLSGFAKADDLAYFLKEICGVQYIHQPALAPTDDILKAYKKEKGDWRVYEEKFLNLMASRKIEALLKPEMFNNTCLLCSEDTAHNFHRRLVCEYLNGKLGSVLKVKHL